jgi:gluconate 2-dehydrogenase gamma chain
MAGQSPTRRDVLQALVLATAADAFQGFAKWSFAQSSEDPRHTQTYRIHYNPTHFKADQFRVLEQLSELILPSDGTPGARDAGVAEFIDFIVARDSPLQKRFDTGFHCLDALSTRIFLKPTVALASSQQIELLERIANKQKVHPREQDVQDFFKLLRRYTVIGFYTSRIGLESLDFPGLRFYANSPACPHHDNPEHRGL